MSSKIDCLVDSESNDDSSGDNSSKDRKDRSRSKFSEKRKKHKKHKKQKKSKKHRKERNSSDAEQRNSKSETRIAPKCDDSIEPSLIRKTTRDSVSPSEHKSANSGKPWQVDLLKQVSSRWDSFGECENSRQTLNREAIRIPRSEDSTMHNNDGYVDKGRSNRNSLHEQQNSRTSKSNTHRYDNRDATGDQGNRNENHHSRTYNKHGSNQQYERDSDNRSIQQASGSRDNEKKSRSCDPEHHVYQTNQNLKGERCNQSTADKYYTSNRKRRYGESPYKQPSGRETSAQKQNNVERQNMGKAHVKEEKNSRYDEETEHTWGRRPDSRSKTFKANDNDKPNSESAVASDKTDSPVEKEKPNFGLSGKLTEEANKVNGVVIAYSEPPGARKPKRRWRLYPFKGDQALPTLYIHRQSCYLIGRDRRICDLPVDHPSCSKQHAVLQYRLVPYERNDGTKSQCVRPYIIDLESSNGTFVNNKKIESKRYLELREKDVLKFGFSSREYVLLHENSKEDNEEDEGLDASPVSKTPNDPTHLSKEETK